MNGRHGPWRHSRVNRRRFFRRVIGAILVVLLLAVFGALGLAWLAATSLGVIAPSSRGAVLILLFGGLAGSASVGLTLTYLIRRLGTPVGAVMEAADRVATGDYSVRVIERGPPPVRGLARAFNTMTARLEDHDRLRRNLMADVAHELRTPLTVIQGKLEGLLDGVYPRDDRQLGEALDEAHVLARLIEDLRTLALSESGGLKLEREPTDVAALAGDVVRAFDGEATSRRVKLAVHAVASNSWVALDPIRIREVLANLLANALRHTPPDGSVVVSIAEFHDRRPADRRADAVDGVVMTVQDTGTGMAPEELARAFERFHKGPDSRGSGLGLTIAKSLVEAHGGQIRAASQPGVGTTVTVTLPRS